MSRLFGAYVILDWSAAEGRKTGEQSIWIGVMKRDVRFRLSYEAHNPATRAEAATLLRTILADLRKRGDRALVGFDFNFGLPRGTAQRLQLSETQAWSAMWKFLAANVVDKADNTNNRFAVAAKMNRLMTDEAWPFWGCPARQAQRWLSTTKPETPGDFPEFRLTETVLKGLSKRAQPKSVWQMHGAGVVGGQTLLGIPFVRKLAEDLGESAAIWPYGTGLRALSHDDLEPLSALLVEVYPSLYPITQEPGEAKDAAQVRTTAEVLAKLDEDGKLGALFAGVATLSDDDRAIVEGEEGWILGA